MRFNSIGTVKVDNEGMRILVNKEYLDAMVGMDGFSHINVLWWFSECDNDQCRNTLQEASPYKNSPEILGAFAMRSPMRPNPIALTCAGITYIDYANGVIGLTYIDADDNTPVLDIKPYTPSFDRVEQPSLPEWCAHWPKNTETSGDFDWENEFNF